MGDPRRTRSLARDPAHAGTWSARPRASSLPGRRSASDCERTGSAAESTAGQPGGIEGWSVPGGGNHVAASGCGELHLGSARARPIASCTALTASRRTRPAAARSSRSGEGGSLGSCRRGSRRLMPARRARTRAPERGRSGASGEGRDGHEAIGRGGRHDEEFARAARSSHARALLRIDAGETLRPSNAVNNHTTTTRGG
jgi:hypothetical protein